MREEEKPPGRLFHPQPQRNHNHLFPTHITKITKPLLKPCTLMIFPRDQQDRASRPTSQGWKLRPQKGSGVSETGKDDAETKGLFA